MVISDLNIVCLQEKHKHCYKFKDLCYKIMNNSRRKYDCFYGKNWDTMASLRGVWYYIYTHTSCLSIEEGKLLGLNFLEDGEFFDLNINGDKYELLVSEKHKETIKNLIDFHVQKSPIKKIAVLCRLEDKQRGIQGIIKKEEFINKMFAGELEFDIIYIVSE